MNDWRNDLASLGDSELAKMGVAGDRNALEELFRRQEIGLFAFVSRFIAGVADPEDVYQEIVLRAIQNMHRFNPNLNFRTWLYTLAANHCKNVLRAHEQRGKFKGPSTKVSSNEEEEIDLIEVAEDGSPWPDRNAESAEFMRALDNELANLPVGEREVFVLREFDGLPFREISSILKIPEATARSRMFLAIERLRTRLKRFAGQGAKSGAAGAL